MNALYICRSVIHQIGICQACPQNNASRPSQRLSGSNVSQCRLLLIQANILKAEKMDLRESQSWLSQGYQSAAISAALGAGITAYNTSSAGATLGVGLASGLVGMAADALVEDTNYTMVTDVQIAERTQVSSTNRQCGGAAAG